MGRIVILDEITANQIAAGEVIERPASVVKEMVENALDAKATAITVDIVNGGIKYIRITDNGEGIEADDAEMAFERHGTSKIRKIDDLNSLATMGFRGEALASIAAVSKMEMITKTEGAAYGIKVIVEAGNILAREATGAPQGTTFIVKELFHNTPARYKFLKKDTTEAGYVHDIITRLALARPDVSFKLINQGKTVIHTPGNHDLLSVIYSLYGKEIARAVLPVNASGEGIIVGGYVGKPEIARGNRSFQSILVNGRFVYNRVITAALEEAYKTRLMQKRFPFAVIKLDISPQFVDVNVHPAKLEVRFSDDQSVYRMVYHAVSEALSASSMIPGVKTFENGHTHFQNKPDVPDQTGKETGRAAVMQPEFNNTASSPKLSQNVPLTGKNVLPEIKNSSETVKEQENHFIARQSGEHGIDVKQAYANTGSETVEKPSVVTEGRFYSDLNLQSGAGKLYTQPVKNGLKKQLPPDDTDKTERRQKEGENFDEAFYEEIKIEGTTAPDNAREKLINARFVGQVFGSFVLLEAGDEVLMIDQHAAHERIRYEKLKRQFAGTESFSQGLLSPVTVSLTEPEMEKVRELSGYFTRLGFEIEDFGSRTIIIRAIPYALNASFSAGDFIDILDRLSREVNPVSEIIPEETIYMMACKSAVKANRNMTEMEVHSLISELAQSGNPYTCVHGRPVIICMTKKELEKRFKRIV